MALERYLADQVSLALEKAAGHRGQAARLLKQWSQRDHKLLLALAEPHLPGLITHAIKQHKNATTAPKAPSADIDAAGMDALVAAMAANSPSQSDQTTEVWSPNHILGNRSEVRQTDRQARAIRKLAGAYRGERDQ